MKCDFCGETATKEIHIHDKFRFYNNLFVCKWCLNEDDIVNYRVTELGE